MSNQQVNDLADESSDLERLWAEHLNGEFLIKDVETTLETMVDDAYVNQSPSTPEGEARTSSGGSIVTILYHPGRAICG